MLNYEALLLNVKGLVVETKRKFEYTKLVLKNAEPLF